MLVSVIFVALVVSSFAVEPLASDNSKFLEERWAKFKNTFHRSYESQDEEEMRFQNFVANLKLADERNLRDNRTTHGVTKFSDWSFEEFSSRLLKAKPFDMTQTKLRKAVTFPPPSTSSGLINWTGIYTTPVKNQGYCGASWAFSAVQQIESDAMRTKDLYYTLSTEQVVQCDYSSFGCDGGYTNHAYLYVYYNGGIATSETYPYTSYNGLTGTCNTAQVHVVSVTDYYIVQGGESAMANYVQTTGPLSVCIDSSTWITYTGGIISAASCGDQVNNCVQVVGVDISTSNSYWIIRGSWGTDFGVNGFVQLEYGANACGIESIPTYTSIGPPTSGDDDY